MAMKSFIHLIQRAVKGSRQAARLVVAGKQVHQRMEGLRRVVFAHQFEVVHQPPRIAARRIGEQEDEDAGSDATVGGKPADAPAKP